MFVDFVIPQGTIPLGLPRMGRNGALYVLKIYTEDKL